ncbi:MAG: hypothetical protein HY815_02080 [Candidatus Riflebacteria bacterium]|nr:hypothetical protein [Candidatus Riflebacteria bacterium]
MAPRYRGGGCHLYWITQGRPGEKRDQAHKLGRFLVPQKAAAPGMLKFRTDQLDNLISRAGIVFDTDDLPADQAFLSYFTPDRLERLAGAASTMRNPSKPKSGLLQRLAEVLKAPAKVAALAPYLKDPELSVAMYALWRLDRQLCGSCVHLADGTIRKAASTFMGKPVMSEQQRRNCPCRLVREGIWPPEGLLPADPDKLEE